MPKIPDCNRCLLYTPEPHLVCGVHPHGVEGDSCMDFRPNPKIEPEEPWSPEGYSWYGNELIPNKASRYTTEQQIEMLDNHPFFTGVCPNCQHQFERTNTQIVHFDCPSCGWIDESV